MRDRFSRAIIREYKDEDLQNPYARLSFGNFSMLSSWTLQDQITVLRDFDYSTVASISATPLTPLELSTLRTLPNEGSSGSSMYTLQEEHVIMSSDPSDYVWKNGIHHSRGSDIQLPVVSSKDSITIVHRSTILSPVKTWEASEYLKSQDLNGNKHQIFWAYHELDTTHSYPDIFDVQGGLKTGLTFLDVDGIIEAKFFPDGIAPTGDALDADLSGGRLTGFGDVVTTIPFAGYAIEWRDEESIKYPSDFSSFTPSVAFGYTGVVGKDAGTIIRKRWWGYQSILHKTNHMNPTTVDVRREHDNDGVNHAPRLGELLGYYNSSSQWQMTGSLINNTPIAWEDPGDTWYPPHGNRVDSNDPNVTEAQDRYHMKWSTATGKWEFSPMLKDIHDYHSFRWDTERFYLADLNDVRYTDLTDESDPSGTPSENRSAKLLTWKKSGQYFEPLAYNTWHIKNVYSGSSTITDPTDTGYTGGYTDNDLPSYIQAGRGWVMYWDTSLHGATQDPSEDPTGAWNYGLPLSWDPLIKTDMDTATDGQVLKVVTNSSGVNEWRIASANLSQLGNTLIGEPFEPEDQTYLVFSKGHDTWGPRDIVGGIQTYTKTKRLQSSVSWIERFSNWYTYQPVVTFRKKMYDVVQVQQNCTLTGFAMFQPKEGEQPAWEYSGPGYDGGVLASEIPYTTGHPWGFPTTDDFYNWLPAGVVLYKITHNFNTDDPDGDDHPDDTWTLINNTYDGQTARTDFGVSDATFSSYRMLDRWWRENDNGGDRWLSLDVELLAGQSLAVVYQESPYRVDNLQGVRKVQLQKAHCLWRLDYG